MLKELILKIQDDAAQIDDTQDKKQIMIYFDRTLKYIKLKTNLNI
jgi:hypothetical protein